MKVKPLPFKLSPYRYIILREASNLVALLLDFLNLNKILNRLIACVSKCVCNGLFQNLKKKFFF